VIPFFLSALIIGVCPVLLLFLKGQDKRR